MSFKIKPVGNKARVAGSQLSSHLKGNPLKKVAKETLDIINTGMYSLASDMDVNISDLIEYSVDNTEYYLAAPAIEPEDSQPLIEVTSETTTQAASRLLKEGKKNVVALNFASATNAGGGWLHGAKAQEEDLCRRSSLYESIRKKWVYYSNNIVKPEEGYTDGMIYSPSITFFRDEYYSLLHTPYSLSIITAPAPNVWSMKDPSEDKLREIFSRRTKMILRIAAANKHRTIILGAWGCGAFGNNAQMVAETFDEALREVRSFDHVCFAVYDTHEGQPIFNSFYDHFVGLDEAEE